MQVIWSNPAYFSRVGSGFSVMVEPELVFFYWKVRSETTVTVQFL